MRNYRMIIKAGVIAGYGLLAGLLLVLWFFPAHAAEFSWKTAASISRTPTQIGAAIWKGELSFAGAAACYDPLAVYGNGILQFGLGEVCGAVGGGIRTDSGRLSLPLTFGLGFVDGGLSLHGGWGPDLLGSPVSMFSFTYPF